MVIGIVGLVIAGTVIPIVIYQNNLSIQGIEITSDKDFNKYNFAGTGAKSNPYIIENLHIKPKHKLNGIFISDVSKYFIIRNCTVEAYDIDSDDFTGISIRDLSDFIVTITHNTLRNCEYGIKIFNSGGAKVSSNILLNCALGINVIESGGAMITNNYISQSSFIGIRVEEDLAERLFEPIIVKIILKQ